MHPIEEENAMARTSCTVGGEETGATRLVVQRWRSNTESSYVYSHGFFRDTDSPIDLRQDASSATRLQTVMITDTSDSARSSRSVTRRASDILEHVPRVRTIRVLLPSLIKENVSN